MVFEDAARVLAVALTGVTVLLTVWAGYRTQRGLERDRQEVEVRLRGAVFGDVSGPASIPSGVGEKGEGATRELPLAAQQRIDDDRFAELLVQRYAYGLTQSQRSFLTSQVFSVLGGGVLLTGVGLAIWRAETDGDLYAAIVTTTAGIVTTVIGRLFHRESDKALKHMASETDSLRDDMRAERSAEQAILLLAEVDNPEIKARLQAGLIMRFAGSEMPGIRDADVLPAPRAHRETASPEQ
ncbi:TRADD-N-associated membrane domain-containing protein [Streptomyces sp. ID05-18]|uniref:TRADD-N-associated membrane domain-containing protein n=1 Tax=Streptomyces sp. ID05-18 TaxID=3028662 RepID=UPI0029AD0AA6|nr:hypothetical protein [Streptomyces sp. ID05-18]MDX3488312.1 hypothetical protein [Streptomyces sp. ID05-18]